MPRSRKDIRSLLAIFGVVVLLATTVITLGTARPTEATWQDTVHGASTFSAGQPYARGISTYGTMFPPASSTTPLGPNAALAGSAWSGTNYQQRIDGTDFSGVIGFLPMEAYGRACARVDPSSMECLSPRPQSPDSNAYAVAETGQLKMSAGGGENVRLVTLGHALNLNSASTTAECRPGEVGVPGLNSNGEVILGGNFSDNIGNLYEGGGTRIRMPSADGVSQGSWSGWYRYTATITHTSSKGINHARSQLRLHVRATTLLGSHRWTLDMILADAECGTALRTQDLPDRPAHEGAMPTVSRTMTTQVDAPGALQPIVDQVDDELSEDAEADAEESGSESDADRDEDKPSLPTLDDAADEKRTDGEEAASDEATTTRLTSPSTTTATATPTTPSTEPETSEPSTSATATDVTDPASSARPEATPTESPDPTTSTEAPAGPQRPQDVRVGREFAVTTREGVELGTARIEDVTRLPDCGVEITLEITTSAEEGPERWASIDHRDFAEVRPGGSPRPAQRASSECASSAATGPAQLRVGDVHEVVVVIQISDTAQRAMFRPDGTAGWRFDLPPLPTPTATAPATTTTTSATAGTSPSPTAPATTEASASPQESAVASAP